MSWDLKSHLIRVQCLGYCSGIMTQIQYTVLQNKKYNLGILRAFLKIEGKLHGQSQGNRKEVFLYLKNQKHSGFDWCLWTLHFDECPYYITLFENSRLHTKLCSACKVGESLYIQGNLSCRQRSRMLAFEDQIKEKREGKLEAQKEGEREGGDRQLGQKMGTINTTPNYSATAYILHFVALFVNFPTLY